MKRILKYQLGVFESNILVIASERILSVKEQYGNIVVYALVDDQIDCKEYEFIVEGTGHVSHEEIESFTFLDTVKLQGGELMWHIFYRELKKEDLN